MNNYTDEQLRRVAEWLDMADQLDRNHHGIIVKETGGVELEDWLLSPEGRVAIEDKLMRDGGIWCYQGNEVDGVQLEEYDIAPNVTTEYSPGNFITKEGFELKNVFGAQTLAEAWLDAAVKFTEAS